MNHLLEKLQSDFARNRGKALALGVLSVVMLVFVGKAVLDMTPRAASAAPSPLVTPADAASLANARSAASSESEERIRQSQQLWHILREKRGVDVVASFSFDPAYFTLDPTRRPVVTVDPDNNISAITTQPSRALSSDEVDRRARATAIRDQAKSLVVRSTVVGGGRPVAVVNEKILSLGDRIVGFEVVAIKAREVEFKKDGVVLAVKMADEAHPQ